MDSHKHTLAHTESGGVHPTVESKQQIPRIENVFKDYKYKNTTVSQIASCGINHKERTHGCIRQHDNLGKCVLGLPVDPQHAGSRRNATINN